MKKTAFLCCLAAILSLPAPSPAESLAAAMDAAVAASRPVRAAGYAAESAGEALSAAKAQRLPVITASADHFRFENVSSVKALGMSMPVLGRTTTGAGIFATAPIFTGGRIRHGIEAAQSAVNSAQHSVRAAASDVRYETAVLYAGVIEADALLAAARAHLRALESHRRNAAKRVEKGVAVKNELYAAEAARMTAEDGVIAAGAALEVARSAYNRQLGRELGAAVELEALPLPEAGGGLAELTERALASSAELASMEEAVRAARAGAAAEKGGMLPQVGFVGGWMHQNDPYLAADRGWMAGVVMKWDLFDGGMRKSKSAMAGRQADALEERRLEARSMLELAVRTAWQAWEEAGARERAAEASLKSASENMRVTEKRYAAGLTVHTEVLDAESLRGAADARLVKARCDRQRAAFRLRRLAGTL